MYGQPHQDRKVRSLAKKVLGSMRMGVVRAMAPSRGFCGAGRLLKYQSSRPLRFLSRPKPAQRPPICTPAVEEPSPPLAQAPQQYAFYTDWKAAVFEQQPGGFAAPKLSKPYVAPSTSVRCRAPDPSVDLVKRGLISNVAILHPEG